MNFIYKYSLNSFPDHYLFFIFNSYFYLAHLELALLRCLSNYHGFLKLLPQSWHFLGFLNAGSFFLGGSGWLIGILILHWDNVFSVTVSCNTYPKLSSWLGLTLFLTIYFSEDWSRKSFSWTSFGSAILFWRGSSKFLRSTFWLTWNESNFRL